MYLCGRKYYRLQNSRHHRGGKKGILRQLWQGLPFLSQISYMHHRLLCRKSSFLLERGQNRRNVIVMPDRDAIPKWKEQLSGMRDLANFTVSDFCERLAPENQPKFDIADYIQQKWMSDMQQDNEGFKVVDNS